MKFCSTRKVISIIVALLMTAAMISACATPSSAIGTAPAATSTPEQSAAASATASAAPTVEPAVKKDPMGKYDPGVDIMFARAIDDDTSSNVLPKCPGETIEDNRWTKLIKEQFGINIKYKWTVKGSMTSDAYTQKINVELASGEIPDVVIINSTQLKQLTDAEMVTDMTQYFNDYATDLLKKVYTDGGMSTINSATFGGKLMAIPSQDDAAEAAQFLWIRMDWLKKLNLEVPKTMDDLLKVSAAFTTQDPDGNGKNDTYGLAITKDLYSGCMGTEGFFAGYHAYPNMWLKDNSGKLVYGSIQPETKAALKSLAEMYAAGQIDKEFGVKDGSKVAETIAAGKIGIDFGEQWNPMYPLISNFNNDNNADWTGYSIVSADSQPVKVPMKFRVSNYYAVRNGYEHPEAIVKILNLFTDINCGERSKTDYNRYFMPPENGNQGVWKFCPATLNPPLTNYTTFLSIAKARETNDMSGLNPAAKPVQANLDAYKNGDKTQWGWDKIYGEKGVYLAMNEYQANNALLPEEFCGAPTKTMVERKATLDKMEKEMFVKIIMGSSTIDEFDKFVSDWNKLGGEAITQEVNEWYASLKK